MADPASFPEARLDEDERAAKVSSIPWYLRLIWTLIAASWIWQVARRV